MMSCSRALRRDMIADSGSLTGPSLIPSVRSSSRISGAVWRCRSLVTCSVSCRASFTSAMRPAYGAEEMGIGGQQVTIVVDVANVMGSRPDGWWRDRAGAAVRLHAQIVALASSGRAILPDGRGAAEAPGPADEADPAGQASPAFVMVLEGAAKAAAARLASADPATAGRRARPRARPRAAGPPRPGEVRVVQAPGSGDDAIVAVVRELPGRRVVVTADRGLRERCVAAGAEILGPSWLLGLLRG